MSLVGPRPHALSHDHEYERRISLYARRHNVKPGITGWAQINGYRGEIDTDEKMRKRVEHDLFYIDNWSLWLDLKIMARTVLSPAGLPQRLLIALDRGRCSRIAARALLEERDEIGAVLRLFDFVEHLCSRDERLRAAQPFVEIVFAPHDFRIPQRRRIIVIRRGAGTRAWPTTPLCSGPTSFFSIE